MELVSSQTMQKAEKALSEKYGVDTLLLMENAGRGVTEEIVKVLQCHSFSRVYIMCGMGNNGGDGLAIARHLRLRFPTLSILVYLVGKGKELKKDARFNYQVVKNLSIPVVEISSSQEVELERGALVVDALLGTGITREVEGIYREVIEKINASDNFVVAVDVPSGVEASDGRVMGEAVRANLTVTLGLVKRGLCNFPGREYAGKIKLVDIGIPLSLEEVKLKADGFLITPSMVKEMLPQRHWDTHKISAGVLGVVAGSSPLLGAGLLVCLGGYRSGAGMVVWPLASSLSPLVKLFLPEVVSVNLSSSGEWHYSLSHWEVVEKAFQDRKCGALAVGPGMGTNPSTRLFLEKVVENSRGVIDADALNIISQNIDSWKGHLTGWVITPHSGEMARILGVSTPEVNENRIAASLEASSLLGCVTVLKGAGTVVASPRGEIFLNPTGTSVLASAGSGDVLTGIIAGFMAQGMNSLDSAISGVFLHGLAGELLEREGKKQILSQEIAGKLNEARRMVENGEYTLSFLDGD